MFLPRRPDDAWIRRFLAERADAAFTYEAIGATAAGPVGFVPPPGFVVDHHRTRIGSGDVDFRRATEALHRWVPLRLGWVEPFPGDEAAAPGAAVAVVATTLRVWSVNPARVVCLIDEDHRRGFTYGTLPGHAAAGEERFLIELDPKDGGVWYDVFAFSRPDHWLSRAAYPYMRRQQRRFGRDSPAAMRRAITP